MYWTAEEELEFLADGFKASAEYWSALFWKDRRKHHGMTRSEVYLRAEEHVRDAIRRVKAKAAMEAGQCQVEN